MSRFCAVRGPPDRIRTLVAAALVISVITRLGWLDLVEFQNDESWALTIAEDIAQGRQFPLIGIGSSLNTPNAPFFVYLMAIPELISRDPAVATGLIGILAVGAVAMTYWLASYLFSPPAGVVAALFYAISPWGIIYSRKVWAQDALPIFVTIGLAALFAATRSHRCSFVLPGLLALTLATQLHPTAFYLAPPAFLLVVRCLLSDRVEKGQALRWLSGSLLAALLIEAPFIVWQTRHGWAFIRAAREVWTAPGAWNLDALRFALSVAVGDGYSTLADVRTHWTIPRVIEGTFLLGGLLSIVHRIHRPGCPEKRIEAIALAMWLGSPIILQLHHSVPLYPHYFIVLYPAPFLVMGSFVDAVGRPPRNLQRHLPLGEQTWHQWPLLVHGMVGVSLIAGLVSYRDYMNALARGALRPEFGVTLGRQRELVTTANSLAAGGPVYVASHNSLASTLAYLSAHQWRVFDDRRGLWLPSTDQSSVLLITDATARAGVLSLRWLDHEPSQIIKMSTSQSVQLFRLAPGAIELAPNFHSTAIVFESGLTLTGYRLLADENRGTIEIDLHWRFSGAEPRNPPTVFNHLVDLQGRTVAQIDGLAYQPGDWIQGDVYLDEFIVSWPRPSVPCSLEIGLYDYPSMRRYKIISPGLHTPSDALNLGDVSSLAGRTR